MLPTLIRNYVCHKDRIGPLDALRLLEQRRKGVLSSSQGKTGTGFFALML